MGNHLIWNEQYNVGVEIIDKEHKKLFSILNRLFDFGRREKKSRFACHEAIKYFKEHAIQHFADEEAYMASINYPDLDTHRRILFFVKHFSLKKASEFPVFIRGFSLLLAGNIYASLRMSACSMR